MKVKLVCVCVSHQAGWFPFRVELQNPRPADRPPAENNRNHNIQEMVSSKKHHLLTTSFAPVCPLKLSLTLCHSLSFCLSLCRSA